MDKEKLIKQLTNFGFLELNQKSDRGRSFVAFRNLTRNGVYCAAAAAAFTNP